MMANEGTIEKREEKEEKRCNTPMIVVLKRAKKDITATYK